MKGCPQILVLTIPHTSQTVSQAIIVMEFELEGISAITLSFKSEIKELENQHNGPSSQSYR